MSRDAPYTRNRRVFPAFVWSTRRLPQCPRPSGPARTSHSDAPACSEASSPADIYRALKNKRKEGECSVENRIDEMWNNNYRYEVDREEIEESTQQTEKERLAQVLVIRAILNQRGDHRNLFL